ncbi:MAG: outer membrane protein transport protein [Gammaproteobacteria bacterium]|nr:outer membrane protein transport protein [Gammaproteobacteria bacterium]
MRKQRTIKQLAVLTAAAISTVLTIDTASASGFQIFDQDAAQLGNYYAGGATGTDSAGSEFYNPATMTQFDKSQLELGVVDIHTNVRFVGQANTVVYVDHDPITLHHSGDVGGGGPNYVPDLHLIVPVGQQWALGLGITTPFGLATDYPTTSFAANAATESSIQTININPSIAYKANKYISFGAGFDAQQAQGEFDQQLDILNFENFPVYNTINNTVSDWAYGWNAGMLIQPTTTTRFGLSYRSKIVHHAQGTSSASLNIDGTAENGSTPVDLTIPLPATTILSVAHDFKQWTVMASAYYTQWKSVQALDLQGVEILPNVQRNVSLPENFRNTWNMALGADYRFTQKWTWQMGVGYDQSPVNDDDRDIRLPDSDRRIVATGLAYQATDNLKINVGYAHFFSNAASVDDTEESMKIGLPIAVTEEGTSYASADVFGLAVNYSF